MQQLHGNWAGLAQALAFPATDPICASAYVWYATITQACKSVVGSAPASLQLFAGQEPVYIFNMNMRPVSCF